MATQRSAIVVSSSRNAPLASQAGSVGLDQALTHEGDTDAGQECRRGRRALHQDVGDLRRPLDQGLARGRSVGGIDDGVFEQLLPCVPAKPLMCDPPAVNRAGYRQSSQRPKGRDVAILLRGR